MRRYGALIIIAMTLSLVLAACLSLPELRLPTTCAELLASPLQAHIGQPITPAMFAQSVERAHGVPPQEISVNIHEDDSWFMSWSQNGLGYGVSSENGVIVDRIGIELGLTGVPAQNILECLPSQPEWYSAVYGPYPRINGIRYAFSLYFPTEGIVVTGTGYDQHNQTPPPLTENTSVSRVFIGAQSSLSDLYKQRWGKTLEEVRPNLRLAPWPGKWEAVHFVEDHEMG